VSTTSKLIQPFIHSYHRRLLQSQTRHLLPSCVEMENERGFRLFLNMISSLGTQEQSWQHLAFTARTHSASHNCLFEIYVSNYRVDSLLRIPLRKWPRRSSSV
jgi:hypothetical protein